MLFDEPQVEQGFPAEFPLGGTEVGEFLSDLLELLTLFDLDELFEEAEVFFIQGQRVPISSSIFSAATRGCGCCVIGRPTTM